MTALLAVAVVFLAVLGQVTVAPLFPVSAALPDFVLVALTLVLVYRGPRVAMVALPLAAIWLAFASNRAPGLLVLAYLPLLPLCVVAEQVSVPLNRSAHVLAAAALTGLWARLVLAISAMLQGADPAITAVIGRLLLPGLLLDLALVALLYFPLRLLLAVRPLTLQRSAW